MLVIVNGIVKVIGNGSLCKSREDKCLLLPINEPSHNCCFREVSLNREWGPEFNSERFSIEVNVKWIEG